MLMKRNAFRCPLYHRKREGDMAISVHVTVKAGPVLRTALDVLDLARNIVHSMPEYCPEKEELSQRVLSLSEIATMYLQAK